MLGPRQRPVFIAAAILLVIWVVAFAGYRIAKNARVTPDKVRAYVSSVDFSHLTGADREAALRRLAAMLNALSLDERQGLRRDGTINDWFSKMTEAEKGEFLDATMPTGFKQMIGAFEDLPQDKRERVVGQAMKQLKEQQANMAAGGQPPQGSNNVALSPELQDKVTKIGLQTFYSQSSAETKAELAPLLEQMQQTMQSGRMMRGGGP
jgi:hypothetical protein